MVRVVLVDNKSKMEEFFDLPYKLHRQDPVWVPPLKSSVKHVLSRKNPFFHNAKSQYWLAYKGEHLVGRLAGFINYQHNKYYEETTAFWGFFESIESQEVSSQLFKSFEDWAVSEGMNRFVGPMNPSINYECGLQISAFNTPAYVMMTQNPSYYHNLIESQCYVKCQDLEAWKMERGSMIADLKRQTIVQKIKNKHHIKIRTLRLNKFRQDLSIMQRIYDDAWRDNWGYLPLNFDEFYYLAKELKHILLPNFIYIAEIDDEPCAFAVAIPNLNQILIKSRTGDYNIFKLLKLLWQLKQKSSITQGRVALLGVLKKYQKLPLGLVLYEEYLKNAIDSNITEAEFSWVLEDNAAMKKGLTFMGAMPYKSYRIYEKHFLL